MTIDIDTVLQELSALEPLYHAACPEANEDAFAQLVAADFWEIAASGRVYDRAYALNALKTRPTPSPENWQTDRFAVEMLAENVYLLTYTLRQPGRVTLRMTLWLRHGQQWQARFHQGTVVTA